MPQIRMLELTAQADSAVIVLHEIYGINRHITDTCAALHAEGHDVYCPDLLDRPEPFPYDRRDEAHAYFLEHAGFYQSAARVNLAAEGIRPRYRRLLLLGFSAGATLAWLCADSGLYDGAAGLYGSRIRDYVHAPPRCPALLLFARREASFDPAPVAAALAALPGVRAELVEAAHGFCDKYGAAYDAKAAAYARRQCLAFLAGA